MAKLARPARVEGADAWLDAFCDDTGTIVIDETIAPSSAHGRARIRHEVTPDLPFGVRLIGQDACTRGDTGRAEQEEAIVHARLTTVEFDTADHRREALKQMSAAVQVVRAMRGFEAAYYLDVDELHIVSVLMFDSEEDFLQATGSEYEALQKRAREKGAKYTRTDEYRVMAFATNTE
jgi:hypothetical protein